MEWDSTVPLQTAVLPGAGAEQGMLGMTGARVGTLNGTGDHGP